jgi:GT2 family glycosyltransferase
MSTPQAGTQVPSPVLSEPAAGDPLVSVLIVSYNVREMTVACINSLRDTTSDLDLELLVVDNASEDGSDTAIEAVLARDWRDDRARLIRPGSNLGFARANNLAASEARGRYLLLLNPDTVLRQGTVQAVLACAAARPAARIWGGRTVFADGTLNPTSCWGRHTLWSVTCQAIGLNVVFRSSPLFNAEAYGGWKRDTCREVDIVTGCFLLIERSFWEQLGGFDSRFFMYAEEADLCLRARAYGARPVIAPEAELVHYGGASETARAAKLGRIFQAKITLIDEHWSIPARVAGRLLYRLYVLNRAVGYGLGARLTGRASWRQAAVEWAAVWASRNTWLKGYS